MTNNLWTEKLINKYQELKLSNILINEVINISQARKDKKNEEIKYEFWEKTVEDIFKTGFIEELKFSASLGDTQENYGDFIAAFKSLKWCLIEFKKTHDEISRENEKFAATNDDKYYKKDKVNKDVKVIKDGKSALGIEIEIQAFNWLRENFGNGNANKFLEPHFIIYRSKKAASNTSLNHLEAIRYWGEWSKNKGDDQFVKLKEIPEISESYENFVNYASLFRVAKSGDFMLAESDSDGGTGGYLKDLSLVIGIDATEKVKCINTLDSFLKKIENLQKHSLHNDVKSKASMRL